MKVLKSEEYDGLESLKNAIGWDFWLDEGPIDEVRRIIARVSEEGDAALSAYTREFDGIDVPLPRLRVTANELAAARDRVTREFADAVKAAVRSITAFHRHQAWESQFWESDEGARIGQVIRPLRRIGVYVPGGVGAYPSTAMMTVIPAKVAGVHEIAVCVPPAKDGEISPYTLYVLDLLGIGEIYRVGGAQAIAALALGTQTIATVDKIVGPGNIYVTLAKKEVLGRVGIDMLAGPSELVVLSDGEGDTETIVLEMAAQMEHGGGAKACLVTSDAAQLQRVEQALAHRNVGTRPGDPELAAGVLVMDLDEGARLADLLAPEHLLLLTADVTATLAKIHNAGAVFLGIDSPVALGDYAVGTNHVIPTKGAARYASPLGVYDFLKRSNVVFSNPKTNRAISPVVEAIARVEGFINHAEAMRKRLH